MVPEALFVTGTDTGVGKTAVAAALALHLRRAGFKVAAIKPVETGPPPSPGQSDAEILQRACGGNAGDLHRLYHLRHPLAPAVAAELEGVSIDVDAIVHHCRSLRQRSDSLIVEGAGGVLVPIRWDCSYLDLIQRLAMPVLIVARAGLGTLNHTCLTHGALRERGIDIWAIVLNRYPAVPGLAERTNPEAIRRLTGLQRVFTLPAVPGVDADDVARNLSAQLKVSIETATDSSE